MWLINTDTRTLVWLQLKVNTEKIGMFPLTMVDTVFFSFLVDKNPSGKDWIHFEADPFDISLEWENTTINASSSSRKRHKNINNLI